MYASFYKLTREPFHITPDPEFLFLSPSHKEALGSVIYGVGHRKGFVLITGEVGVGKTTIIRSYLEEVDKQKLKIIYIFNAKVSFPGLLKTIYQELGVVARTEDVYDLVNHLHEVLIEEYKKGFNVVLIIDEAQNMPVETLENLRMLSNLETSTDKLIQIVFCGQPEFVQKLNRNELRQLKQRIAVKSTILPLNPEESLAYIRHRLAKASADNTALFTGWALKRIIKEAHGIPRLINILCENAFITALGYRQKRITSKIVKEVISDFAGKKKLPVLKLALASSIFTLVMLCAFLVYHYKDAAISMTGSRPDSVINEHKPAGDTGNHVGTVKGGVASRESEIVARSGKKVPGQDDKILPVLRTVKKGDTLSGLVEEVYGVSSKQLLNHVRENNSGIRNVDRIAVGEKIIFPAREKRNGKTHE